MLQQLEPQVAHRKLWLLEQELVALSDKGIQKDFMCNRVNYMDCICNAWQENHFKYYNRYSLKGWRHQQWWHVEILHRWFTWNQSVCCIMIKQLSLNNYSFILVIGAQFQFWWCRSCLLLLCFYFIFGASTPVLKPFPSVITPKEELWKESVEWMRKTFYWQCYHSTVSLYLPNGIGHNKTLFRASSFSFGTPHKFLVVDNELMINRI